MCGPIGWILILTVNAWFITSHVPDVQITSMVRRWLYEVQGSLGLWDNDLAVADWIYAQMTEVSFSRTC